MNISSMNRLIKYVMPNWKRKSDINILDYITMYTHLIKASELLNVVYYKKSFNHMLVIKRLALRPPKDEEYYYQTIRSTIKTIISQEADIIKRLKDYEASDPCHAKTKLLLAQNICILRILNNSSSTQRLLSRNK